MNDSGAEVEPPSQSRLLDATMSIPGVLIAGVPGAGGYDAIFTLVLSAEARTAVADMWSTWNEAVVRTLTLVDDGQGIRVDEWPAVSQ